MIWGQRKPCCCFEGFPKVLAVHAFRAQLSLPRFFPAIILGSRWFAYSGERSVGLLQGAICSLLTALRNGVGHWMNLLHLFDIHSPQANRLKRPLWVRPCRLLWEELYRRAKVDLLWRAEVVPDHFPIIAEAPDRVFFYRCGWGLLILAGPPPRHVKRIATTRSWCLWAIAIVTWFDFSDNFRLLDIAILAENLTRLSSLELLLVTDRFNLRVQVLDHFPSWINCSEGALRALEFLGPCLSLEF